MWKRLRSRERAWERKGREGKGREGKGKEGKGKETGDREKGYLIRENFQSRECKRALLPTSENISNGDC